MATLTLTIATLTASRTVANARAQAVLLNVFDLHHPSGTYTNQEKLDWIVQVHIPALLTQESKQFKERATVTQFYTDFNAGEERFE